MTKSPTTYIIRPGGYPGHWDIRYARANGLDGYTGSADSLQEAIELARMYATSQDSIFVRKSLYRGNNAGAWHGIGRA